MDGSKKNIDASIYIIDKANHIVYFNATLKQLVPEVSIGIQCHQAFYGSAVPCHECPLKSETGARYYNQRLHQWMEVSIGNIEWPGKGLCSIIISRHISEQQAERAQTRVETQIETVINLYRKQQFYQVAEEVLQKQDGREYSLVAIDIEHFKLFNEWYGKEAGDQFLIHIGKYLKEFDDEVNSVSCYLGSDDFMVLLPDENENLKKLQDQIIGYVKQYSGSAGFLPLLGVYEIKDREIPISTMHDRAVIAMSAIKGNYMERISRYDAAMMQQLEENHVLFSEVQQGLKNNEFLFYLQPKCNMATGRIVGLESLVRWQHPERGIVSPREFIPFLEESGFIVKLDLYVWNEVCIYIRKCLDEGRKLPPISVNVSRVDIYTMDVAEHFKDLVGKYNIPPQLLEIEITESDFAEGHQVVPQVVEKMQNAGFTVLMDDFGSGYSSLNMLKDINVDVLKLDMKFLEMNEGSADRGLGILEAIIRMSRLIEMRMIAEGVETKEQVESLLDMGCLYGQGYYFYRPLQIEQIETLLENPENFDYRGTEAKKIGNLGVKDLLKADMFSETMIHNMLGGIGFYKVNGSDIELMQVNEYYYKVTGSNPIDLEEQRKHIQERIYEEDREKFAAIFRRADRDRLNGGTGEVRRLQEDNGIIWVQLRIFYIKDQEDGRLYYGAISDITEKKRREENLKSSQKALQSVLQIAGNDTSFMGLAEENQTTASAIFAQMTPGGMIGGYCEEDFPLYFANSAVVKLLGYDSFNEFSDAIHRKVINTIHPDDREQVTRDIGPEYYAGLEYTTRYRMPKKDGTWFWTVDKGKVIRAEDGRLAIVSAFMDISDTMEAHQKLKEKNRLLRRQNQELSFMRNNIPGGYHWCENNAEHDFIYIGQRFQEIFGYTKKEINDFFDNKYMNMVHPDDRAKVKKEVAHMVKSKEIAQIEYRMNAKDGYKWIIDQSQYVNFADKIVIQGFVLDVTESVNLRNTMKSIMRQAEICSWSWNINTHTLVLDNIQQSKDFLVGLADSESEQVTIQDFPACFLEAGDILGEHRSKVEAYFSDIRGGRLENKSQCEFSLYKQDGTIGWIRMKCELVRDEEGNPAEAIGYYSDITKEINESIEKRDVVKALEAFRNQALYDFKVSLTEDKLCSGGNAVEWLEETEYRQSMQFSTIIKYLCSNLISPDHRKRFLNFTSINRMMEAYQQGIISDMIEYQRLYKGEMRWMRMNLNYTKYDVSGEVFAYVYVTDIDVQKKQELNLTRLAETDAMTGLYNRSTAKLKIEEYFAIYGSDSAVVIMFDMDNFKVVNDVFGHTYGDDVIKKNALKLQEFFRKEDIICRMGGDEFLVLCKSVGADKIRHRLEKIVEEIPTIYNIEERTIKLSISAGYAVFPDDGKSFDELYQRADIALFTAKMHGKGIFKRYDSSMKHIRYELAGIEDIAE